MTRQVSAGYDAEKQSVILASDTCKFTVATPAKSVLLLRVEGSSPRHLESSLMQQILGACHKDCQLQLFLDLQEAKTFPIATVNCTAFIDVHAALFGRIYILATNRMNQLTAAIVQHMVERKDVITIITARSVFDTCLILASGALDDD